MACFITKRWKFLTVLVVLIALPTVAGIIGWRHIQRNYNGEALAKLIMKGFNKNRRGRLELTSVTWQPRALFDVITGQPTYVVARGLKMYDVRGKKVVDVPLATGYVDVDPLRKNLSLVFENVKAHGGSISIEMFDSPDEKGRREIGLLGMIRSKPKTKVEPDKPNELAESSFVISVKGFDLKDVQLVADLPSLDMTVSGLALSGGHLYFGSESMEDSFRFHLQGRPTARDAKVRFLGANHRFSKIQFLRGYMDPREPMNLHFALTAMEGDTPVRARAFLGDHGVIVDVTAKNVGRIASRYIPLINLNDGPGSEAHIKIRGTIAEPIAQIQGSGLRFINGYGPSVDNLSGTMLFQRVEGHSTINFLDIKGTTLDATLVADGMWDLLTGNIYTKINGVALNPREFVSASVGARLPHIVDGEVTVRTVFPDVRNVEFGWKMKGKGGDLSYLTSNGSMSYVNGDLDFKSLRIDASEISIRSSGIIGKDRSMAMRGTLTGRNMGRFLKRMGIAPLLSSLDFSGLIRGTVNNPRISGQMTAGGMKAGITTIPALHSHVNINKSGATFAGVNGRLARGKISGSGGVNWSQGFFVFGQGQTKGVELSLLTKGVVKGQLQAHGRVRGQVSRLTGKVTLAMADGAAYGWKLKDAQTAITLKQGAVFIDKGKMELSGSKVTFMGSLLGPKGLGLDVKVAGLNLDALRSPIVTGVINADLGLRGSVTAPYLLGNATLSRARIHGRPAGSDITLRFYREKKTNLFSGNVFNKIAINGQYQSLPKPQSIVTVAFNDMDPALFISPRLLRSYGVDMLLSGSGEAILKPGSFPAATLRVTKARVGMTGIPNKFGPTRPREVLKLGKPLLLTLTKRGIKAHRFNIAGLGTDLDLEAFYDFKQLTGKLDGDVGMTLVPYFMPQGYMERATGSLSLKIAFLQKSDGLDLNGSAYFAGNQLYRSMGGEKITIRAGKITFAPRKLTLDTVRVVYEEEEMVANGQLDLGPWVNPTHMSFDINGLVSSKALFLLAAGSLYSTTGRSRLDLHVSGATTAPQFKGRLKMVENNRIYLRSGREITLAKDSLATFSGPNVRLVGVKVEMEDGFILADGGFTWQKGRPVDMDIALQLRNLVERSSSYEFEMMGNLRLFCQGNDPLTLRGTVNLLNGSYKKKYNINLVDKLLTPVNRTSESSSSSMGSIRWLSDMRLDLIVQLTGDIEVDNNFAQTKLEGVANVSGTLGSPTIGGVISLNGGSFRIPMLRGTYEIKEGIVDFDRAKQVKHVKDEPYLDVTGEMIFTDRLQNEHIITLKLHGFISQLKLSWSSSTGLSSSQVLMLLMLNRTPDEIRRGETGGIPDLGGVLEGLVPLNLQLGISSEAVKVYVDKKFMKEHLILRGNVEVGFMGRQMQEAFLIFRLSDNVSVQAKARRKIAEEEAAIREDEDELQGRVELKYKLNLKGSWKDVLGL